MRLCTIGISRQSSQDFSFSPYRVGSYPRVRMMRSIHSSSLNAACLAEGLERDPAGLHRLEINDPHAAALVRRIVADLGSAPGAALQKRFVLRERA